MSKYLTEAFKSMNILDEDTFQVTTDGVEKLDKFLDGDLDSEPELIIDPEAETDEDLQDTYVGKVILNCPVCESKIYKDVEEVTIDDETSLANVGEECPYCQTADGFEIVGQIEDFDAESVEDDKTETEPTEDELDEGLGGGLVGGVLGGAIGGLPGAIAGGVGGSFLQNNLKKESANTKRTRKRKSDEPLDEGLGGALAGAAIGGASAGPIGALGGALVGSSVGGFARKTASTAIGTAVGNKLSEEGEPKRQPRRPRRKKESFAGDVVTKSLGTFIGNKLSENEEQDDQTNAPRVDRQQPQEIKPTPKRAGYAKESFAGDIVSTTIGTAVGNKLANKGKKDKKEEPKKEEPKPTNNGGEREVTLKGTISEVPKTESRRRVPKKKLTEAPYLEPQHDSRKSFYNKAFVDENDVLYSYGTKVMEIKNGRPILTVGEDLLSQTTLRHIKEFLKQKGFTAISKQQIIRDYSPKKSVKEDFNKVDIETDEQKMSMTSDANGKVTVTTEPIANDSGDMIAPISDETKDQIVAQSTEGEGTEEEPAEGEFTDIEIDEFDEEEFDELGESYLKRVYENVESFKTIKGRINGNKMIFEGLITFKSGKKAKTSFMFESKTMTKSGKVKLIGENRQISKNTKAFTLTGNISGKRMVCESLNYNYLGKDAKTNTSKKVYGTITRKK